MKGSAKVARIKNITSISPKESNRKVRPALTPEAMENQMIADTYKLVHERILNGTATSQETTHFLKLGSQRARMELEKMQLENELIKAKTKAVNSSESSEQLYKDAIAAFQKYSGNGDMND